MSFIAQNICNLENIFSLTDTYTTQVFYLSIDCPLVEAWGLLSLSTTVGGEVEKSIRRNWLLFLIKMSVLLLDSQGSG